MSAGFWLRQIARLSLAVVSLATAIFVLALAARLVEARIYPYAGLAAGGFLLLLVETAIWSAALARPSRNRTLRWLRFGALAFVSCGWLGLVADALGTRWIGAKLPYLLAGTAIAAAMGYLAHRKLR